MNKKDIATAFLKTVVARRVREAYEKYTAPHFKHHNQYFKGDRESLMNAMEEAHSQFPDTSIDIKQVLEEGDKVMTHSLVKHRPEDKGIAVVHIFRFEKDKVVELWDLGQELLPESPNENGPF